MGDITALWILIPIGIYAAFEYARREEQHRKRMAYLKKDTIPPDDSPKPALWKMLSVGSVALVLLLVTIKLILLALKGKLASFILVGMIVGGFAIVGLLARIAFRDFRAYKLLKSQPHEVTQ